MAMASITTPQPVARQPRTAFARENAIEIRPARGFPVAARRTMSLRCAHQGVPVKRDESGWVCLAHGSEFTAAGALELGPATTGLPRVASTLKGGTLTVG